MALQEAPTSLLLAPGLLQRVHIPDDEIRHNPGLERVTGPTVSGDYEVCTSCDAPEQTGRVRRAVQEDGGPHVTRFSNPGSAVVLAKAVLLPAPSAALP